jgi:putative phage-type endonuclease
MEDVLSKLDHALRRRGVTGSEIAAVAGLSPYAGPLEIWARKLGKIPPLEQTPAMRRGTILEPSLCQWAAEERGLYQEDVGTLQCERHPLVIASPDRVLHSRPGLSSPVEVLEVKAPARTQHVWTNPADDAAGIDPQYLPQVTWEMAAAGLPQVTVGALCYGDLWLYRMEFDPELFGLLLQAAERFWRDHILAGKPPPVHGAADADVLRRLYKTQRTPLRAAPEAEGDVSAWRQAETRAAEAEAEAKRTKAVVMSAIGSGEGIESPGQDWRVTWRQNRPTHVTDWRAVAMAAGASSGLIEEYTTERQGARVVRYTERKQQ